MNIGLRVLTRPNPDRLPEIYRTLGTDYAERVLPSIIQVRFSPPSSAGWGSGGRSALYCALLAPGFCATEAVSWAATWLNCHLQPSRGNPLLEHPGFCLVKLTYCTRTN